MENKDKFFIFDVANICSHRIYLQKFNIFYEENKDLKQSLHVNLPAEKKNISHVEKIQLSFSRGVLKEERSSPGES